MAQLKMFLILLLLAVNIIAQPIFLHPPLTSGSVSHNVGSQINEGSTVVRGIIFSHSMGFNPYIVDSISFSGSEITISDVEQLADSNSTFSDTTTVGGWLDSNMVLVAENDSTFSIQDTNGSGYAYLPIVGLVDKQGYQIRA